MATTTATIHVTTTMQSFLMLDAGAWFNEDSQEQARAAYASTNKPLSETLAAWATNPNAQVVYSNGLYISALADQIAYAEAQDAEPRRRRSSYPSLSCKELT